MKKKATAKKRTTRKTAKRMTEADRRKYVEAAGWKAERTHPQMPPHLYSSNGDFYNDPTVDVAESEVHSGPKGQCWRKATDAQFRAFVKRHTPKKASAPKVAPATAETLKQITAAMGEWDAKVADLVDAIESGNWEAYYDSHPPAKDSPHYVDWLVLKRLNTHGAKLASLAADVGRIDETLNDSVRALAGRVKELEHRSKTTDTNWADAVKSAREYTHTVAERVAKLSLKVTGEYHDRLTALEAAKSNWGSAGMLLTNPGLAKAIRDPQPPIEAPQPPAAPEPTVARDTTPERRAALCEAWGPDYADADGAYIFNMRDGSRLRVFVKSGGWWMEFPNGKKTTPTAFTTTLAELEAVLRKHLPYDREWREAAAKAEGWSCANPNDTAILYTPDGKGEVPGRYWMDMVYVRVIQFPFRDENFPIGNTPIDGQKPLPDRAAWLRFLRQHKAPDATSAERRAELERRGLKHVPSSSDSYCRNGVMKDPRRGCLDGAVYDTCGASTYTRTMPEFCAALDAVGLVKQEPKLCGDGPWTVEQLNAAGIECEGQWLNGGHDGIRFLNSRLSGDKNCQNLAVCATRATLVWLCENPDVNPEWRATVLRALGGAA